MPTVIHRAVIATMQEYQVTESILPWLKTLDYEGTELFLLSLPLHNGYQTVVMVPDGSGEGREYSEIAKKIRKSFVEILREIGCEWVEVEYGDTILGPRMTRSNEQGEMTDEDEDEESL